MNSLYIGTFHEHQSPRKNPRTGSHSRFKNFFLDTLALHKYLVPKARYENNMRFLHRDLFDSHIHREFSRALKTAAFMPSRLPFLVRAIRDQERAARLRSRLAKEGLEVPPLLIISVTRRCNFNCAGCYSRILHHDDGEEMSPERFDELLLEATELGISLVMLAGGEPLTRKELLEIAARHQHISFPIFTNGSLIDEDYAAFFGRHPNLIPVISVEGGQHETDLRRGYGSFDAFKDAAWVLDRHHVYWGVSITLNRENYELALSSHYARDINRLGSRLFFYVEYVPVAAESLHLVLNDEQKQALGEQINRLKQDVSALFIAFPGDEEQYGGCLAAGRGFLHINPSGRVEPCPFAPYSDADLRCSSLKEVLASPLLAKIRSQHQLLTEGVGGCALWANRELIDQMLSQDSS